MIRSFKGDFAEAAFNGEFPKRFPANLVRIARRKLDRSMPPPRLTICVFRPATGCMD